MSQQALTLGIEAAVVGGSISLCDGNEQIASWVSAAKTMSSELLLPEVDRLLNSAGHTLDTVGLIAISAGPGSFTGIRIGAATGEGLARALSTPCLKVSLLAGMAADSGISGIVTSIIPMGRDMVCRQTFDCSDNAVTPVTEPFVESVSKLEEARSAAHFGTPVFHSSLDQAGIYGQAVTNLARCIAIGSQDVRLDHDQALLFISKPTITI